MSPTPSFYFLAWLGKNRDKVPLDKKLSFDLGHNYITPKSSLRRIKTYLTPEIPRDDQITNELYLNSFAPFKNLKARHILDCHWPIDPSEELITSANHLLKRKKLKKKFKNSKKLKLNSQSSVNSNSFSKNSNSLEAQPSALTRAIQNTMSPDERAFGFNESTLTSDTDSDNENNSRSQKSKNSSQKSSKSHSQSQNSKEADLDSDEINISENFFHQEIVLEYVIFDEINLSEEEIQKVLPSLLSRNIKIVISKHHVKKPCYSILTDDNMRVFKTSMKKSMSNFYNHISKKVSRLTVNDTFIQTVLVVVKNWSCCWVF